MSNVQIELGTFTEIAPARRLRATLARWAPHYIYSHIVPAGDGGFTVKAGTFADGATELSVWQAVGATLARNAAAPYDVGTDYLKE